MDKKIVVFSIIFLILISSVLADKITVKEGELVKLKLAAYDPDGDKLTYTFSSPLNDSGEWQTDYYDAGTYTATIKVSDGKTETSKKLTIEVLDVNGPPEIKNINNVSVKENELVKIKPVVTDPDKDKVTVNISDPLGNDGEWQTTYDDAGNYAVTVTASDKFNTVEKKINIVVENVNRIPFIVAVQPEESKIDVDEGSKTKFKVNASDPDKDNLIYEWSLDEVTVSNTTSYEYKPDFNSSGSHKLKISVSDGFVSASKIWGIEVKNVNRAPLLKKIKDVTVNETEFIKIVPKATDPDNDDITITFSEPLNKKGEWQTTYDDEGIYYVNITASDGKALDVETVKIKVKDKDRPPLFSKINDVVLEENETIKIKLNAVDPDGDSVRFEVKKAPKGAEFINDTFTWTPSFDAVRKKVNWFTRMAKKLRIYNHIFKERKAFDVEFIAWGKFLGVRQKVKLIIKEKNRPPVLEKIDDVTVNELGTVNIEPKAVDPDGDDVYFSFSGWMNTDKKKTGYEDQGSHNVTVTASDGKLSVTKTFVVDVVNINRAPVFKKIKDVVVHEGDNLEIKLDAKDPDGDSVYYYGLNMPKDAKIKNNIFSYTPDFEVTDGNKKKFYNIALVASDNLTETSQNLTITVKNTNRDPEIIKFEPSLDEFTTYKDGTVDFYAVAKDPDNNKLSYTWKFGSFEKVNAKAIKRKFGRIGRKKVTLVVSDGSKNAKKEWIVDVIEPKIKKSTVVLEPTIKTEEKKDLNLNFKTYVIE